MNLSVYSRADLSRTVVIVVALFLAAASTTVVACEFPTADVGPIGNNIPASFELHRSVGLTSRDSAYAKARRDPVIAEAVDRLRNVE